MACSLHVITFLMLIAFGWAQGLDRIPFVDTDWKDVSEDELTLEPNKCKVFKFDMDKSQFRITLDVADFAGCDPADIKLSEVFFEGECFKKGVEVSLKPLTCDKPGKHGVEGEDDICENDPDLITEVFAPNEPGGTTKDIQGPLCFEDSTYYFAMRSSCDIAAKVKVSLDKRTLPITEDSKCLGVLNFREDAKSFGYRLTHDYLWLLILLIVIVVVLSPVIVTLSICFCTCCHCCACCVTIAKTPFKCCGCVLKPAKKIVCCCK